MISYVSCLAIFQETYPGFPLTKLITATMIEIMRYLKLMRLCCQIAF